MEVITPSQYFEQHSRHCPLLQAFNGLRFPLRRPSRKVLWQLVLFLLLVCVLCNFYDWVKDRKVEDTYGGQSQPNDGGVGGHGNTNGGGHSNNERSGEDRGGSRDPPQAPSSRGGGSSSSGDNGGDDPNKKRPTCDKAEELMEVESTEEEISEDDESQASDKEELVTNKLQPPPGRQPQLTDASRHMHQGSSVVATVCTNPWSSSSHASLKSFEQSQQLRMCPLEEMIVHEVSNDERQSQQQQQPQSAASIGEEQLNLELFNSPATGGILDQLSFYTTIDTESFSGPHSDLSQEVSTESVQSLHANTYYDLAHLDIIQEQVLQAAETTEPFDYTLAFVFDYQGNQLLIPCLPDAEFDPAEDVHVVAIPADCVVPKFTVRINPQFHRIE